MNFPVIRLTVEGMRHEILHALSKYNDGFDEYLDRETKRAVETFNFGDVIAAETQAAIRSEVKAFFSYGAGRKMIREAFQKAMATDA
jgi:hypothetical protein